jgi:hypothetical protein
MSGFVEVESYVPDEDAWVLETRRTDRKVAEMDMDLLRMLGKRCRIVGEDD